MRSRNIKPGFFKNDELGGMDPLTRLLFAGLWCYADKAGRFEWRPKRIMAEILPYDNGELTVIARPLVERGFIVPYEVDGSEYCQVVNFDDHQHPHHTEKESKIPSLDKGTVISRLSNGYNPSDSLIPDSLIPDSDKYVQTSDEVRLSELLLSKICEHRPKFKKPDIQKWAKGMDYLLRIDVRSLEDIESVITWLYGPNLKNTDFSFVVQSPESLRRKFDQIQAVREQSLTPAEKYARDRGFDR